MSFSFCSQCPLNHCLRVAPPCCTYLVVDFSPCRLLCCSFSLPLFYLSSSLLLTSLSTHLLALTFFLRRSSCHMNFSPLLSHFPLLLCHFLPVTFLHAMFSVIHSPFVFFALALALPPLSLLSSYFLSLHYSFRPLPSVSLVILISIPFTIPVSLANSAIYIPLSNTPCTGKYSLPPLSLSMSLCIQIKQNLHSCDNGHIPSASLPSLAACKGPYYAYPGTQN